MSAFRDGWVCPSCYAPNRPADLRCYACRLDPWSRNRTGQPSASATGAGETWAKPRGRASEQERVIPTVLKVLIVPIGVVYVIQGFLGMVIGAFYLVLAPLSLISLNGVTMVITYLSALLALGFGWLWYQLGKKILTGRRWAWLIGLVLAVIGLLVFALADWTLRNELGVEMPSWWWWLASPNVYAAAVLGLALASDILIRAHFRGRERRAARRAASAPVNAP